MYKTYSAYAEVSALSDLLTVTTLRPTPVLGIDDTAAERRMLRKKGKVLPEPHRSIGWC